MSITVEVQNTDPIAVDVSLGGSGANGEANNGVNLGSGEGEVFAQKSGVTFQYRSLRAGTNIAITQSGTELLLEGTAAAAPVQDVFGRVGNIIAESGDYDHSQVTDDEPEKHRLINDAGTSITELFSASEIIARLALKADESVTSAHENDLTIHYTESSINHSGINDDEAAKHRLINDAGNSLTELFSAAEIVSRLALKADDSDLTSHTGDSSIHYTVASIAHSAINDDEADKHRLINDAGTLTTELFSASEIISRLSGKEDSFAKSTAFNKDFGSTTGTVCEGDDSRLSDARTPLAHVHDTADITTGTFADALVAESNVTQHEAALSILESQISDLQSYLLPADISVTVQGYDANTRVLLDNLAAVIAPTATDDAAGGYSVGSFWVDVSADESYILVDSTNAAAIWKRIDLAAGTGTVTQVDSGDGLTGGPITTTGTLSVDYAGTGVATTVARSDHDHDLTYEPIIATKNTAFNKDFAGTGVATTVAKSDHNHDSSYATTAQGTLADSSVQPLDNVSTLTNDAGYTTNVGTVTSVGTGDGLSGTITTSGSITLDFDTVATVTAANGDLVLIKDATDSSIKTVDLADLIGGGGGTTFTALTDTPADYTGHAGKFVKVNATPDGLEFVTDPGYALDSALTSHTGDDTIHFVINDAGPVALDEAYSSTKIESELSGKSDTSHLHTGVYEPAASNIQNHISTVTGNPHAVSLSDVGGEADLGNPSNDGDVLSSTIAGVRSWITPGGGGGTPGGADTQIQYNNGGVFGGDAAMVFNDGSKAVDFGGALNVSGNITISKAFASLILDDNSASIGSLFDFRTSGVSKVLFGTESATPDVLRVETGGYVQVMAIDTTTGIISGNGYTPAADVDLATKKYVDDNAGGGTPGGADTQIQYNNGGVFGGDAAMMFNDTSKEVTFGGDLIVNGSGVSVDTEIKIVSIPSHDSILSFYDDTTEVGNIFAENTFNNFTIRNVVANSEIALYGYGGLFIKAAFSSGADVIIQAPHDTGTVILSVDAVTPKTITLESDGTMVSNLGASYAALVTADGDLTDKKYVDDAITAGAPDLSAYAKLDGTNQPFTGNVSIEKTNAELTIKDTSGTGNALLTFRHQDGSFLGGINPGVANNSDLSFSSGGTYGFDIAYGGVLNVTAPNYETLVLVDDDIPNKKYVDDAITSGSVSDHGALTGLADNDHLQYLLNSGDNVYDGNLTIQDINNTDGNDDTYLTVRSTTGGSGSESIIKAAGVIGGSEDYIQLRYNEVQGIGHLECTGSNRMEIYSSGSLYIDAPVGAIIVDAVRTTIPDLEAPTSMQEQTGTAYTPVAWDADKMIKMDNSAANVVTIPSNASVSFPIGTKINIMQYGLGSTSVSIDTDTLNVAASLTLVLDGRFSVATAMKVGTTEWVLFGHLVPV